MSRPNLRVVNADTGEIYQPNETELALEELTRKYHGALAQIGNLRREISELRAVEPEVEAIMGVLDYWREKCRPRAAIAPGGKRWEKARARLREKLDNRPPLTVDELKLAVDGALADRWHSQPGQQHRLDAEYLFRNYESVEKLRDIAIGFKAQTGVNLGNLYEVGHRLRWTDWKFLLRVCSCGHTRVEHAHPDPSLEGRELCFKCECPDFDIDPFDPVNGLI